jgi:hypothetical protein
MRLLELIERYVRLILLPAPAVVPIRVKHNATRR